MRSKKKLIFTFTCLSIVSGGILFYQEELLKEYYHSLKTYLSSDKITSLHPISTASVIKRSYPIEVRTIGELEAARSISIATTIRSDQPKIIELVADGSNVKKGDLLIRLDAVSYENKVADLLASVQENEGQITAFEQALIWENEQAKHEAKAAAYELEVAQLELNKTIKGDGPLEIARLHAAMLKTKIKYEELNLYADDLIALEEEGFLNPAEVRQTQKKLQEELEAYQNAKMQYESFVEHVHPMQIKKAESALKRNISKQEEAQRSSKFKISKAQNLLDQSQLQLAGLKRQLNDAYQELSMTDIYAPSAGMVVHKEDFRSGQRRKPRIGDTLLRGQTVLDLPDMTSLMVKTKVREIDLYKIDVGKPATIEVDAYPNVHFTGSVEFIGVLATADQVRSSDEKFFELKVVLDKPDERLRPGMTTRVVVHAGRVEEALSVPIHSVFEFDKKHYCFVAQTDGSFLMQPVEIGMNNEQWVEIRSGLNENDQVSLSMPTEGLRREL